MVRALGVAAVVVVGGCQDPYGTVEGQPTAKAQAVKPAGTPAAGDPQAEGKGDPDAKPEPSGAEPVAKRIERTKAGVTLLGAGAEPREVLALAPTGSEKNRFRIEMTLGVNAGGKEVPPTVMPEIHGVLTAEAKRDAQEITYAFSIAEASRKDVDGHAPTERVATAVDNAVAGVKEAKGTITLSDRGAVKTFDLRAGGLAVPGLRPSLTAFQQLFVQLYPVLPTEAIGVGARWRSISHAELGGVQVQHEAMYTLVSRKGDTFELEASFTQAATMDAEADTEHGSTGTAKITLDRRRVGPIEAKASSRTLRNFQVKTGERPSAVNMDQALQLSMTSE